MALTDHDITVAMVNYGGSFVSALGALWWKADDENRARLKAVFPEYWHTYEELAQLHQTREKALARSRTEESIVVGDLAPRERK